MRGLALVAAAVLAGGCSAPSDGAAAPRSEPQTEQTVQTPEDAMAITITAEGREITAELADNAASRTLLDQLPLTIEMRDHLRQEKTGNLPSPLPAAPRQRDFAVGTLGLWGSDHFVIYYREGRVPQPGIVILGRVTGDVSILDRPGNVTVQLRSTE